MNSSDFSDAALVLFGHGTMLNADSGAAVLQHAAELRRRQVFAEVMEAFWKQAPRLLDEARRLRWPRVFFVPFFISEGYFSEEVIPAALGFSVRDGRLDDRMWRRGDQAWFYCRPVGTHASMTAVVLDRARSIVQRFPFPQAPAPSETTLFIAGHGTEQNRDSRQAVAQQAEVIGKLGLYAAVHAVYLEEEPRISACLQLARSRNIVVVPFFIGDGLHVQEDIPVLLGEPADTVRDRLRQGKPAWRNPSERQGRLVWYASSVGTDARMAEVVLARVGEAAQWAVPAA